MFINNKQNQDKFMLKNFFKIAFRNFLRQKIYSFINIAGLAIGIACTILILLWILDELSYDRFHQNADRLYRVVGEVYFADHVSQFAALPPQTAPTLESEYPEVKRATRYFEIRDTQGTWMVRRDDIAYFENHSACADPWFFEIFDFPFISGDPKTALEKPYSIVLTRSTARKYFGEEDPLGQRLLLDNRFDFAVTGVIEDIPHNSHMQFDFMVPIQLFEEFGMPLQNWDNWMFHTYLLLGEGASYRDLDPKIADLIDKNTEQTHSRIYLQPLKDIHLRSHFENDVPGQGDILYVYLFSAIVLFILIIASINFMNLATARASRRAKEVGLRKVVGASRLQLILQYLGEAVLTSFAALLLAILLVEMLLPVFNELSDKRLSLDLFNNGQIAGRLFFIAFVTGIISGSYPAFFLSSFKPVRVLKGMKETGRGKSTFREVCVIIQFAISIALVISSIVVYFQMRYISNKNLGFEKDQLIYLHIAGQPGALQQYETLKNEFLKIPGVLDISKVSQLPPNISVAPNDINWEGRNPDENPLIRYVSVSHNFTDIFKIPLTRGRSFSREFFTDSTAVLINETAAGMMGFENPLDKQLSLGEAKFPIIGVMEDFHLRSFREEISPLVVGITANFYNYIVLRIGEENIHQIMADLEAARSRILPEFPISFRFLDEDYQALYRAEQRLGKLAYYSTALAIFIACLGLFGLASFTAVQRTKEIGIRKALGASVSGIVLLLSKEFAKWVLLANIIAWPVAWFAMNNWLENFAYRIDMAWWIFVMSGALALVIALLTVGYQAVRAANANPVDSLRHE
jgi:ABC-type antimicrobial peptide transport system permease subunit